jgi:hypothetical protein
MVEVKFPRPTDHRHCKRIPSCRKVTVAGARVPAYVGQVDGRTFEKKKPAQRRAWKR